MKQNDSSATNTVLGLILSGGNSQRLGRGDKALRPLGKTSILQQVCNRLKTQVQSLIISANSDPAFFTSFGYPIINDGPWLNQGPLAGILAGCRYARSQGYSHVLSVAADSPFFPSNLLQQFLHAQATTSARIIFASSQSGIHPTFALWPADIADDLEKWLQTSKRRSIRVFAENHRITNVEFAPCNTFNGLDPFFNINTPQDLEQARIACSLQQAT